jgi:hypothetical protein
MPAVARILSRYPREKLAAFIAVAIDLLDTLDGDADLEPGGDDELTGDEQYGDFSEDDAAPRFALIEAGPGCVISDPDSAVDDVGCDGEEGI